MSHSDLAEVIKQLDQALAERDYYRGWAEGNGHALNNVTRERDEAREQLATSRERNAAIAVQLDQYRDERDAALDQRDRYRGALAEISGQCGCADEQCPASIARQALGGGDGD